MCHKPAWEHLRTKSRVKDFKTTVCCFLRLCLLNVEKEHREAKSTIRMIRCASYYTATNPDLASSLRTNRDNTIFLPSFLSFFFNPQRPRNAFTRGKMVKLGVESYLGPSTAASITAEGIRVSSLYFPSQGLWAFGGEKW